MCLLPLPRRVQDCRRSSKSCVVDEPPNYTIGVSPNMWWNGLALVNVFARNLISHLKDPFLCEVTWLHHDPIKPKINYVTPTTPSDVKLWLILRWCILLKNVGCKCSDSLSGTPTLTQMMENCYCSRAGCYHLVTQSGFLWHGRQLATSTLTVQLSKL